MYHKVLIYPPAFPDILLPRRKFIIMIFLKRGGCFFNYVKIPQVKIQREIIMVYVYDRYDIQSHLPMSERVVMVSLW